ncbi:PREDICTED: RNA-binding protein CP29B, chloroplastic-like [Brassica oleracea var. oleracea]|uniref:RRM domain-containing protein n=1 Tax=Brassica oleracea var. oleracea TaxID=109376 RepID=A0A0D3B5D5_BRAOL|nr:PREDICTED: RNA-binding protein CP29B, chloroplastic-like [Brassica oleracea var. oleracea]
MAASASSLALSTFNPKSLPFSISRPASLLPPSVSFKLNSQPISLSIFASSAASRFVRNVAVTDDFNVEEEADSIFSDDAAPPPQQEQSFSADLKLFVGNLPFNVDSAQLAQLFESAGNVEMVEVIYDKVTGRSRGFGFVTMSSVSEVEAAEQQFKGYELDGRPLRVNAGPPPPKREDSFSRGPRSSFGSSGSGYGGGGGGGAGSGNRVYVGNLSWGVDDMALESLFGEQGKVVEARVIYDRDSGRSKGFGFVTYNSAQEVQNAIRTLNGADLDGRQIRVSEAEARPPRRQF